MVTLRSAGRPCQDKFQYAMKIRWAVIPLVDRRDEVDVVVDLSAGLSPAALRAIADLERRVVAADGGRLKLEWNALRHRSGRDVEDVLWWDGERLLGFLGIY